MRPMGGTRTQRWRCHVACVTATRAAEVANRRVSSTDSSEGIGGGRAVVRVLEANLQHFLEREGIAFINECHKVAVGTLMASRWRKMKSHNRCKSVDLGDRHQFDSDELGERFIKAKDVGGERSRGVILDRHALFETSHNELMSNSSSGSLEQSKNGFPSISTASRGSVIVGGEHFEERAERFGSILERFQSQC